MCILRFLLTQTHCWAFEIIPNSRDTCTASLIQPAVSQEVMAPNYTVVLH